MLGAHPFRMKVGELCKRDVTTIDPGETIVAAAKRMREEHVGDLVVVDDGDRPIGILTDRDLVVSVIAAEIPAETLAVRDVVRHGELVTTTPDEDVDELLPRMRSFAVRRVPVVDDAGRLYGIVALDDVLAWIRDDLAEATAIPRRQRQEEARRRM